MNWGWGGGGIIQWSTASIWTPNLSLLIFEALVSNHHTIFHREGDTISRHGPRIVP